MSEEILPESDPGVQRINSALETLLEHFDSVQIIATRYDGDGCTDAISRGRGNWSARYGSMRESVLKMEESMRENMRRKDDE